MAIIVTTKIAVGPRPYNSGYYPAKLIPGEGKNPHEVEVNFPHLWEKLLS